MKRASVFLIIIILSSPLASQTKVGTSVANFLQIGVGARGQAMGESAVANGSDLSAVYWNPSLAANAEKSQAYFNQIRWFAGIDLSYGAVMVNLGDMGNFAASFYSLNSGQLAVTTEERPEGTGALFQAQDLMIGLSYARGLTDRFNIGGTLKFINSSIWNATASTMAVDIGLTYQTPFSPVTLGMSFSNFGGEMRMGGSDLAIRFDPDLRVRGNNDGVVAEQRTRSWDLPVLFRFGLVYEMIKTTRQQVLLSSDVLYPSSQENYVNVGFEYGLLGTYFLRAGYRQLMIDDAEGGLSFGGGLKFYDIQIDYAWSDRGRLDPVQYFSLGVSF